MRSQDSRGTKSQRLCRQWAARFNSPILVVSFGSSYFSLIVNFRIHNIASDLMMKLGAMLEHWSSRVVVARKLHRSHHHEVGLSCLSHWPSFIRWLLGRETVARRIRRSRRKFGSQFFCLERTDALNRNQHQQRIVFKVVHRKIIWTTSYIYCIPKCEVIRSIPFWHRLSILVAIVTMILSFELQDGPHERVWAIISQLQNRTATLLFKAIERFSEAF
jgi:hypothetical protein